MMTVEQTIARVAQIDRLISDHSHWGPAALSEVESERKHLLEFIASQTPSLAHKKNRSEHAGRSHLGSIPRGAPMNPNPRPLSWSNFSIQRERETALRMELRPSRGRAGAVLNPDIGE